MVKKRGYQVPRTVKIPQEEKDAARTSLAKFREFINELWECYKHDQELINILESTSPTPEKIYDERYLFRKFKDESRQMYTRIMSIFVSAVDSLAILESDTRTRQIKESLIYSFSSLIDLVENFLEALVKFKEKEQPQEIIGLFQKIHKGITSLESLVDKQMSSHFEKNILGRYKVSFDKRNDRLIKILDMEAI
jgi:hypothetical protein